MSDMRDKQPERKEFDWTRKTTGNYIFRIKIRCLTYSSIKNEDVYVKNPTFLVRAMSFQDASEKAELIAASVREAHDIYLADIRGVMIHE